MDRPRILCLIDSIGTGGGAEQLVATLAPKLRERGVDIAVAPIHQWPSNHDQALLDVGVPLHRLNGPYERVRPGAVGRLLSLARRERFDVYWGHLRTGIAYARIAARIAGGKSIATLHSEGYGANPPRRFRHRVAIGFEGRLIGGADARVAVSGAVARDYADFFRWNDIAVAYNGVDVEKLRTVAASVGAETARAAFGIGTDDFLIVTAARYVEKKGQVFLLEALTRLVAQGVSGLRLVLCGSGDASALQASVERLGLQGIVTIAGVIEQTQLIPLIAAADAYVMPSLREPFGIAAAEAMALGTPTILTEVDGFLELVGESQTALMAPAANAEALAERIQQIRADRDAAHAMGARAAKRIAERFSLDACAERWAEIFDAVHHGRTIPPCAV